MASDAPRDDPAPVGDPAGSPPEPPVGTRWRRAWWILVLALLALQALPSLMERATATRMPYSEFLTQLDEDRILSVTVDANEVRGVRRRPAPGGRAGALDTVPFVTTRVDDPTLLDALRRHRVQVQGARTDGTGRTILLWLFPAVLLWMLWRFVGRSSAMVSQQGVLGMGDSRARVYVEPATKVTFADVAGVDEAKAELAEIVAFLRDPQAFGRLGARMPRGVLLVGEPGTGKTLLARAVAGESGVPFYSINGSEFVELFVGIGAARVRSLFAQARAHAPCILFIDEIDALGRSRGTSILSGANDEKEQTLNQLLAEVDGFDPTSGVVLLAATNRPDTLDPALLRAGRFDRQIVVDRPDRVGRAQILAVHVRSIQTDPTLSLDAVAALTPGFTGADLANLANEAALVATRRGAPTVTLDDFTVAVERLVAGLSRAQRLMSDADRTRTACHEMGHALVAMAVPGSDPVQKVSIIPRAMGALGFTMQRPTEDRYIASRDELDGQLTVLMGGRAAELLVFGDLSTGAADDLAKATELAHQMVARFGMDPQVGHAVHIDPEAPHWLGAAGLTAEHLVGSDDTQREIDLAVRERLRVALEQALAILREHRDVLETGRQQLAVRETLSGDDVAQLWRSHGPSSPPPPDAPDYPSSDPRPAPSAAAASASMSSQRSTQGKR